MTPEKFIKDYTKRCSNELVAVEDKNGKKVISYHEWLTPEQALRAVDIAREQLMQNAIDGEVKHCLRRWINTDENELQKHLQKFIAGDKVKIIIIKEK